MNSGDTVKIINDFWFSPRDSSRIQKSDTTAWKMLNAMTSYESRYTIKFDSLKAVEDTVENFIIKADNIYAIETTALSKGLPFNMESDIIYVIKISFYRIRTKCLH